MNKETVIENLKCVLLTKKEALKMRELCIDAEVAEKEADETLKAARGFLRKSIEDSQEIYIIFEDKYYKITPDNSDVFNVFIEEIKIIK